MDENDRPLIHWNTPLQNLVLERQRELESDLVARLTELRDDRGLVARLGASGTGGNQQRIAENAKRVDEIERALAVYDRLAQRPWDRHRGWLSIAALVISISALAARFVGHSG